MIYFDNAATTQIDENVVLAMTEILKNQYGNASSLYSIGRASKHEIEKARRIISDCIGCNPEEIIFTSGGFESDNYALKGSISECKNTEIICSQFEHHAVINAVNNLEKQGCMINWIPILENGMVDLSKLEHMISKKTRLVSVMMVNNEIGTIQDIKNIVKIVKRINSDCLLHTDAVQAVGQVDINVKDLGIDMLSASGHKFNGPKGIGFLYKKSGVQLNNLIDGGQQEEGRRAGTENLASIVGMSIALKNNIDMLDENREHKKHLRKYLLNRMDGEGIQYSLNVPIEKSIESCLNLRFSGVDAEGLMNVLDVNDICISLGSACNSKSKQRSHVLRAIGLSDEEIDFSIRLSLGKYNTMEDVNSFVVVLKNYFNLLGMC
ncbi:MAG: cysteine desulfurase [Eubacterium sp.]|nr:cysteine desulfurase [Eubacterium sp.]